MPKRTLAIVGLGMAGAKLLEDLLARNSQRRYRIEVFGEESGPAYNRMLLSRVLAGEDPDGIRMEVDTSRIEGDVTFHRTTRVDRLDTAARQVMTSDDRAIPYDIAVLATGSRTFVPKIAGAVLPGGAAEAEPRLKAGVFAYRSLDDCISMRSAARAGGNAVVLGGGLLGLEAAKVLSDTGMHTTVVHLPTHLMETQLDAAAGEMLLRRLTSLGLFIRCGRTVSEVVGHESVESVRLDDGSILPADMLVLACGIRPRVEVARKSGLAVNRAVIVNDTLATAVPGVYALGECAEHGGNVYGTVAPIFEQSAVLADILTGENPKSRYRGTKLYTRLKVAGVEVASMGVLQPQLPDDEVVQVVEDRRNSYRKLIVRHGKLIGAMFVGDTAGAATAVQHFDRGEPLPDNRLELLCSLSAQSTSGDREVCNCKHVRLSVIRDAIASGSCTVQDLGTCTGAGTGCGSCKSELARLVAQHAPADAISSH